VLLSLLAIARAPVELAEAEVAVSREWTHFRPSGEVTEARMGGSG
jgi:hypothetical protein